MREGMGEGGYQAPTAAGGAGAIPGAFPREGGFQGREGRAPR